MEESSASVVEEESEWVLHASMRRLIPCREVWLPEPAYFIIVLWGDAAGMASPMRLLTGSTNFEIL